jgi:ankyrin repeat protein
MDPEQKTNLMEIIKRAFLNKNPAYTTTTVLYYALIWDSVELLELLLDEGCLDIEYKNYDGTSLLSRVSFNNKIELTSFLLERGADPLSTDNRGKYAIDYAISTNSSCKLIKLLSDSMEVVNVKPAKKDKF